MPKIESPVTRRSFLKTALAAAAGAAALPRADFAFTPPQTAKYTRYNVMSPGGQRAIRSYAKGVQAMLNLPAQHPQNWFRNAFVHLMDCPHGNWWFFVWHRGYIGYFEETIRNLSGDQTFALPYWDWTTLPEIPQSMFDGVLTPTDTAGYERYTKSLDVFTAFIGPAMGNYWKSLNAAQRSQLSVSRLQHVR
jgi:tyrosinase